MVTRIAWAESEPVIEPMPLPMPFPEPTEPDLVPWWPESTTRENHVCYPSYDPCTDSDFYYNWLACSCFARDPCEKVCPEGQMADWFQTCGECIDTEKMQSLYPEWATAAEISESITDGIQRAEGRPEDWKAECPREGVLIPCGDDEYWNELSCQCFEFKPCWVECPPGHMRDPRKSSDGSCLNMHDLYEELYPRWANPMDISVAELDGLSYKWEQEENNQPDPDVVYTIPDHWDQCGESIECQDWETLNQLSCRCFSDLQCADKCCFQGKQDPINACECMPDAEYEALWPEFATDKDIDYSFKILYQDVNAKYSEPEPWTECNPTPMCSEGYYLNNFTCDCEPEIIIEPPIWYIRPDDWPQCEETEECEFGTLNTLACECFVNYSCFNFCVGVNEAGEELWRHDPTDGCTCISDSEYRAYFPEWADQEDIDLSINLQWQDMDMDDNLIPMPFDFDGTGIAETTSFEESAKSEDDSSFMDSFNSLFGEDTGTTLIQSVTVVTTLITSVLI